MSEGTNPQEEKLKRFMKLHGITGEHLRFQQSCHSVKESAEAAHASAEEFVKNICMADREGSLIVAIVKGNDRVRIPSVAKESGREGLRMATPEEILEKSGYPAGGTPSFGYEAIFLIDPRVMEHEMVYTGGGSDRSLVRISQQELQKANHGRVAQIRA